MGIDWAGLAWPRLPWACLARLALARFWASWSPLKIDRVGINKGREIKAEAAAKLSFFSGDFGPFAYSPPYQAGGGGFFFLIPIRGYSSPLAPNLSSA